VLSSLHRDSIAVCRKSLTEGWVFTQYRTPSDFVSL
jgi:hypothetical protein